MKNLAIIPARRGSKGLKDKNIKLLGGKPLLAYSVEAAIQSQVFEEIMVSTDSAYYADIARSYGAEVPFLRSEVNSSDSAGSWDMVQEVLDFYRFAGTQFDSFCLLQPTSPLRSGEDIKRAYDIYVSRKAVAVVSVCEADHSPLWCGHLGEKDSLNGFIRESNAKRRQAYDPFYRINGAIYIVGVDEFEKDRFIYREGSYAYVMSREKSVDIDNMYDFEFTEFLLRNS